MDWYIYQTPFTKLSRFYRVFISSLSSDSIPQSLQEAMTNSKWKAAVDDDMRGLTGETWEPANLLAEDKPVGSRWLFTVKHKSNGTLRFKARLVW